MSAAKLYRVRVTELSNGFTEARVMTQWVAAIDRREAIKRAKERLYLTHDASRIHVHVENFTGGAFFVRADVLRSQP